MYCPLINIRFDLFYIDFQIYEGDWIRVFDGKEIKLTMYDTDKVKFKTKDWKHDKSTKLLNITKDGIYFEDPKKGFIKMEGI